MQGNGMVRRKMDRSLSKLWNRRRFCCSISDHHSVMRKALDYMDNFNRYPSDDATQAVER